jgi:mitochondrial import receptor subunit TOM40
VGLSQLFFEGGKADMAKGLSGNFQVSHSFSLGSVVAPPSYHFGAIYVAGKVRMGWYAMPYMHNAYIST